ncbi:MAG: hypothetical protein HY601_03150 [Candidatus Omnitrophica bacterium]|nr:hypothetical protein [Candidatus Omnitrophota bacterium]
MGQTARTIPPPAQGDPFWDLVALAQRLLEPDGCPWDRTQTVESLLPYLIEETWEVFETIRGRGKRALLEEELGDLLYTVVFLALLADRRRQGSLRSLLRATRRKMIRRHPHVFGRVRARSADEAYRRWQAVKRRETRSRSASKRLRPLLVECWDLLHRRPGAADGLRRAVRALARG